MQKLDSLFFRLSAKCYFVEKIDFTFVLFFQASKYGHFEVVKLLSEFSSCDTNRKNKEGLTPAEVACSRYFSSVKKNPYHSKNFYASEVYIQLVCSTLKFS
jgi:hypothetical protein